MPALDAADLSDAYETWASDPARTFAQRAFINKALTLSSEQVDQLFIDADARASE